MKVNVYVLAFDILLLINGVERNVSNPQNQPKKWRKVKASENHKKDIKMIIEKREKLSKYINY